MIIKRDGGSGCRRIFNSIGSWSSNRRAELTDQPISDESDKYFILP